PRPRRGGGNTSARAAGGGGKGGSPFTLAPTPPGRGVAATSPPWGGGGPRGWWGGASRGAEERMGTGRRAGRPVADGWGEEADGAGAGGSGGWQLPRGRLQRGGVQDRRVDGAPGGRGEGRPGAARAGDVDRGGDARGVHGRRDRRPQRPAGEGGGDGAEERRPAHPGPGPAGDDGRRPHRAPIAHAASSHIHHSVQPLRAGAEAGGRRDHRKDPRPLRASSAVPRRSAPSPLARGRAQESRIHGVAIRTSGCEARGAGVRTRLS